MSRKSWGVTVGTVTIGCPTQVAAIRFRRVVAAFKARRRREPGVLEAIGLAALSEKSTGVAAADIVAKFLKPKAR